MIIIILESSVPSTHLCAHSRWNSLPNGCLNALLSEWQGKSKFETIFFEITFEDSDGMLSIHLVHSVLDSGGSDFDDFLFAVTTTTTTSSEQSSCYSVDI